MPIIQGRDVKYPYKRYKYYLQVFRLKAVVSKWLRRCTKEGGGGRVERRCLVNFQCRGVLLVWMIVGQGPIVLAVGAGGGCLDIFSLAYLFSFLSPSLWETSRYRLKYCLNGPLNPKQPTNQRRIFSVENETAQVRILAWSFFFSFFFSSSVCLFMCGNVTEGLFIFCI